MTKLLSKISINHELTRSKISILNCSFTKNDGYLFTVSQDAMVNIWNPAKGTHVKEYTRIHAKQINDVSVSTDNIFFSTCGNDGLATTCDIVHSKVLNKFSNHNGNISSCQIWSNNKLLITGCDDTKVRFWDLKAYNSGKPVQILDDARDSITSVNLIDDYRITTSSLDAYYRYYDCRKGQIYEDYLKYPLLRGDITENARCYCINTLNGFVILVDMMTGNPLNFYSGFINEKYSLNSQFISNYSSIVTGSEDGCMYIWDIAKKDNTFETIDCSTRNNVNVNHKSSITTIKVNHAGQLLSSCHNDGTVKVWSINE